MISLKMKSLTKFALRQVKLSCDSEVYFVSEVSPDGEVAKLTSLWTFSSKLHKKDGIWIVHWFYNEFAKQTQWIALRRELKSEDFINCTKVH